MVFVCGGGGGLVLRDHTAPPPSSLAHAESLLRPWATPLSLAHSLVLAHAHATHSRCSCGAEFDMGPFHKRVEAGMDPEQAWEEAKPEVRSGGGREGGGEAAIGAAQGGCRCVKPGWVRRPARGLASEW